ncbi:MAG: ATP-dependent Clp protease adaptor ClpS [Planctomycetes bacterium]|nr:ATP-dependent Clp protease adaptor ClpS [Planctomycetota bacterium]
MTAVAEPVVQIASPQSRPLPPFAVVLHNDDVNEMGRVVDVLVEIVRLQLQDAFGLTLEAHNEGEAIVCRTHRERAEFLRDQLLSKGLTASIERI